MVCKVVEFRGRALDLEVHPPQVARPQAARPRGGGRARRGSGCPQYDREPSVRGFAAQSHSGPPFQYGGDRFAQMGQVGQFGGFLFHSGPPFQVDGDRYPPMG